MDDVFAQAGFKRARHDPGGDDYVRLTDTLRGFLDAFAAARPGAEDMAALDADLARWTARLAATRAAEPERLFGRYDVPGRGQVMAPVFTLQAQDESSLRGSVRFGQFFLGANAAAHGGAITLVFDEVLGLLGNSGGTTMARTAYLHTDFRAVTPLDTDLALRAWVERVDGRKRFVRGEIRAGERLCAEAEGLFVELKPGQP